MDKILEMMNDVERSFSIEIQLSEKASELYLKRAEIQDDLDIIEQKMNAIFKFREQSREVFMFLFEKELRQQMPKNSRMTEKEFYNAMKPLFDAYRLDNELEKKEQVNKKVKI